MRSRHFTGIALTACLLFSCDAANDAGRNCEAGGKRIDVTQGGATNTVYVCDGLDGGEISVSDAGEQCPYGGSVIQVGSNEPIFVCNGKDGSAETVVLDTVEAGEDCTYGGVSLRVGAGDPIYLCNGAPGSDGRDVTVATEPAGENCEHGGLAVTLGDDDPTYVCNGSPGEKGESVIVATEPPGDTCAKGGVKVQVGSDVRYVCHGDALSWHELDADTDAQPHAGYVANGASDLTLTLPETSQLRLGDILRVVNSGTGSVSVTPNAGQTFHYGAGTLAPPMSLLPRGPSAPWRAVASSADGTKLVAVSYFSGGQLHVSSDSGVTWTLSATGADWMAVASSADGTKLLAARWNAQLYVSEDAGGTWTTRGPSLFWTAVASSADGTKLVAAASNGQIYTSTDSGQTWIPRDSNRAWRAVASSADGSKLVAVVQDGRIYTSTDSGQTWTPRESNRNWRAVASSADGTKLVAGTIGGQLYTSTDSGVTWTPRESNRSWYSFASSADGTKLAAAVYEGTALPVDGFGGHVEAARRDPLVVLGRHLGGREQAHRERVRHEPSSQRPHRQHRRPPLVVGRADVHGQWPILRQQRAGDGRGAVS